MTSNFGEPKKKSGYGLLLCGIGALAIVIVCTWAGYVIEMNTTKKGVQWLEVINSISEYANPGSFIKSFGAVFTGSGTAKKGMIVGFTGGMLLILWKFTGNGKRYHRRGMEHGSARWGNQHEKNIIADTNDFYNNAIAASDVFLVLDRKKRDLNAMSEKEKKAKIKADKKREQAESKRIEKLIEEINGNSHWGMGSRTPNLRRKIPPLKISRRK